MTFTHTHKKQNMTTAPPLYPPSPATSARQIKPALITHSATKTDGLLTVYILDYVEDVFNSPGYASAAKAAMVTPGHTKALAVFCRISVTSESHRGRASFPLPTRYTLEWWL